MMVICFSCPVAADKSGNSIDSVNYRPIALVTIFSKMSEHIIVSRVDRCFFLVHCQRSTIVNKVRETQRGAIYKIYTFYYTQATKVLLHARNIKLIHV